MSSKEKRKAKSNNEPKAKRKRNDLILPQTSSQQPVYYFELDDRPRAFANYIPQFQDNIVYFRRGHEAYLNKLDEDPGYFKSQHPPPYASDPHFPEAIQCIITELQYGKFYPKNKGSVATHHMMTYIKLTMSPVNGDPQFIVDYPEMPVTPDFIVLSQKVKAVHDYLQREPISVGDTVHVEFDGDPCPGIVSSIKHGHLWAAFNLQWPQAPSDGEEQDSGYSAWEIVEVQKRCGFQDHAMDPKIKAALDQKYGEFVNNCEVYFMLLEEETEHPMVFVTILSRLRNDFYRSAQAFAHELLWLCNKVKQQKRYAADPDHAEALLDDLIDSIKKILRNAPVPAIPIGPLAFLETKGRPSTATTVRLNPKLNPSVKPQVEAKSVTDAPVKSPAVKLSVGRSTLPEPTAPSRKSGTDLSGKSHRPPNEQASPNHKTTPAKAILPLKSASEPASSPARKVVAEQAPVTVRKSHSDATTPSRKVAPESKERSEGDSKSVQVRKAQAESASSVSHKGTVEPVTSTLRKTPAESTAPGGGDIKKIAPRQPQADVTVPSVHKRPAEPVMPSPKKVSAEPNVLTTKLGMDSKSANAHKAQAEATLAPRKVTVDSSHKASTTSKVKVETGPQSANKPMTVPNASPIVKGPETSAMPSQKEVPSRAGVTATKPSLEVAAPIVRKQTTETSASLVPQAATKAKATMMSKAAVEGPAPSGDKLAASTNASGPQKAAPDLTFPAMRKVQLSSQAIPKANNDIPAKPSSLITEAKVSSHKLKEDGSTNAPQKPNVQSTVGNQKSSVDPPPRPRKTIQPSVPPSSEVSQSGSKALRTKQMTSAHSGSHDSLPLTATASSSAPTTQNGSANVPAPKALLRLKSTGSEVTSKQSKPEGDKTHCLSAATRVEPKAGSPCMLPSADIAALLDEESDVEVPHPGQQHQAQRSDLSQDVAMELQTPAVPNPKLRVATVKPQPPQLSPGPSRPPSPSPRKPTSPPAFASQQAAGGNANATMPRVPLRSATSVEMPAASKSSDDPQNATQVAVKGEPQEELAARPTTVEAAVVIPASSTALPMKVPVPRKQVKAEGATAPPTNVPAGGLPKQTSLKRPIPSSTTATIKSAGAAELQRAKVSVRPFKLQRCSIRRKVPTLFEADEEEDFDSKWAPRSQYTGGCAGVWTTVDVTADATPQPQQATTSPTTPASLPLAKVDHNAPQDADIQLALSSPPVENAFTSAATKYTQFATVQLACPVLPACREAQLLAHFSQFPEPSCSLPQPAHGTRQSTSTKVDVQGCSVILRTTWEYIEPSEAFPHQLVVRNITAFAIQKADIPMAKGTAACTLNLSLLLPEVMTKLLHRGIPHPLQRLASQLKKTDSLNERDLAILPNPVNFVARLVPYKFLSAYLFDSAACVFFHGPCPVLIPGSLAGCSFGIAGIADTFDVQCNPSQNLSTKMEPPVPLNAIPLEIV